YAENRRVANGKAKRLLGWELRYPDYEAGLAAILARE
ncbi:MAG: SDR family NAD(P)-dependent oxidoreductase, partial [Blastomonas fulva]